MTDATVLEDVQNARDKLAVDYAAEANIFRALITLDDYTEKRLLAMNIRGSEYEGLSRDGRSFKEKMTDFDSPTK